MLLSMIPMKQLPFVFQASLVWHSYVYVYILFNFWNISPQSLYREHNETTVLGNNISEYNYTAGSNLSSFLLDNVSTVSHCQAKVFLFFVMLPSSHFSFVPWCILWYPIVPDDMSMLFQILQLHDYYKRYLGTHETVNHLAYEFVRVFLRIQNSEIQKNLP